MAQIVKIEIDNFRGVRRLTWLPKPGINCLVGPGDCGKSTVLQAIDWCIGARRTLPLSDADFYRAHVECSIRIVVTIGGLDDRLRSLDSYGLYIRGFDTETGDIEDEPRLGLWDVLSIQLTVGDDLDPNWTLVSERAAAQGSARDLSWKDRLRIAPAWIGSFAARSLAWRPGSVLTKISDERVDVSHALADAARAARQKFGTADVPGFAEALATVRRTAEQLGISGATTATAMLDAQSVSPTEGAISLHDEDSVPLRNLGLGSTRLLVAGLQRHATVDSSVVLVDEVEQGLEPHRIARLLVALGAKDKEPTSQVFMTTHSPAVLCELAAHQIHIVRCAGSHELLWAGHQDDGFQGPLRRCAEAFLGTSVLICEGATEVGLVRGIDLYRDTNGWRTFMAAGGVLVDAGGVSKIYSVAESFIRLGYRTAVLRDDDKKPNSDDEERFQSSGGVVFRWRDNLALEDELFSSVPPEVAIALCKFALRVHGKDLIHQHLQSAKNGRVDLDALLGNCTTASAPLLAKAAKKGSWFKRISTMEDAAREIVGPALSDSGNLQNTLRSVFAWAIQDGA